MGCCAWRALVLWLATEAAEANELNGRLALSTPAVSSQRSVAFFRCDAAWIVLIRFVFHWIDSCSAVCAAPLRALLARCLRDDRRGQQRGHLLDAAAVEMGEIILRRVDPAHGAPASFADVHDFPTRVCKRDAVHEQTGRESPRRRPAFAQIVEQRSRLSAAVHETERAGIIDAVDVDRARRRRLARPRARAR